MTTITSDNNNNDQPLKIAELDFDTILANLRDWFGSQDQFKDFDFDGSALSILLKNLAYNTHYGAFYVNMAANEGFIGTAFLPRNIYSHAKTLNYLPGSRVSAKAGVDISVTVSPSFIGSSFSLPKYQQFVSEAIDGVNYSFILLDSAVATRETLVGSVEPFVFSDVVLTQGEPLVVKYTIDRASNPKLRYEIPSSNVDIETLSVQTQESSSNTLISTWEISTDITSIDADTDAFFLERGSSGNYTVYFGDGLIGKQPANGNILILSYIVTSGSSANKARVFTMLPLTNVASASVSTISPAAGGSEEEGVDSIKISAPIFYSTQNRAVTKSDFEVIIKKDFPSVGSVSVWGGEENEPPIYGKIFIALSPKEGLVISQGQKDEIVSKLVEDRVTLSLNPEIVDPQYVYVRIKSSVEYDKLRTNLSRSDIFLGVRNAIIDYNEDNLRLFGSKFIVSKLGAAIDDSNPSIVGSDTKVYLEKRFLPVIGSVGTYILDYNTELKRGSILEKLGSSSFKVLDAEGLERDAFFEEKPFSYTGIDDIVVTNPGSGYLEPPLVVITGDGEGANAVAKIVNGRINSITVTNKGENYTTAIVSLQAVNGGISATAKPVIAARFGQLRTYYYNDLKQKVIIDDRAGSIDYTIGQITISAFKPTNYNNYIALWLQTEDPIIESSRGNILIIDTSDPASINIDLSESKR
jgi:hypothetical protein